MMKKITKEWLDLAFLDLESISYLINDNRLTGQVAFLSQQTIEKSLKAIIEENSSKVPRIHSLSKLFELCSAYIELEVDESVVIALDSIYTESRYPGEQGLLPEGKPGKNQVTQYFDFAKYIFTKSKIHLENI
jgi:HEPN domain-containing protein